MREAGELRYIVSEEESIKLLSNRDPASPDKSYANELEK
jgi:hypothetical protein